MPAYITHNIVTTPEEDAIVAAIQQRIGASPKQGYSTAIRFIIREYAALLSPPRTGRVPVPRQKPKQRSPRRGSRLVATSDVSKGSVT